MNGSWLNGPQISGQPQAWSRIGPGPQCEPAIFYFVRHLGQIIGLKRVWLNTTDMNNCIVHGSPMCDPRMNGTHFSQVSNYAQRRTLQICGLCQCEASRHWEWTPHHNWLARDSLRCACLSLASRSMSSADKYNMRNKCQASMPPTNIEAIDSHRHGISNVSISLLRSTSDLFAEVPGWRPPGPLADPTAW